MYFRERVALGQDADGERAADSTLPRSGGGRGHDEQYGGRD